MRLKNWLILLIIIALAAFLRLFQLGHNPPALDWDEASLGWNAYTIFKTGTDEYGKALPVSIRSFNDYKPPVYVYAAIPSIAVFGLNEFSVRLPSAIAGILTVLVMFFWVRELTKNNLLGYLVSGLLAISPWHLQFSRVAFEANLALFFFILGAVFLVYFLNRGRALFLILSTFFFAVAIYSYHSSRLAVPLFLAGIAVWHHKTFIKHWKIFLLSSLLFLLSLYPLARNTFHTRSLSARLDTVSAFSGVKPLEAPQIFARNYLSHFNFDFLFLTADGNGRHSVSGFGLMYLVEAPFLLLGLYHLAKNRPKFFPFILLWIAVAPIASATTRDTPHAVRALLLLPPLQLVVAYGLSKLRFLIPVAAGLLAISVFSYLHQYYIHAPIEQAKYWQYGYKQMVKKVLSMENNFDRIYVTSAYDQSYIYFLFYGRIAPWIKNNGYFYSGFDKYEFSLTKKDPKGLYVVSPQDSKDINILDRVYFPDGTMAFQLGTIK